MNNRKVLEAFLVLLSLIFAFAVGKTLAQSGPLFGILPILACFGVFLGFRHKTMLPPIVLGMIWYYGGSPFVKDIPYVFYVCFASLGIAILNHFMRQDQEDNLLAELPGSGKASLLALGVPIVIFLVITVLKHTGALPVSDYGVAGGLRRAVLLLLTLGFSYLLLVGRLPQSRFKYIPHVALAVSIFGAVIDAVNFISPNTAFITWYLTTSINFEVMDVLRGTADSVLRLSGLRELGMFGALFILSRYVDLSKKRAWGHVPFLYLLGLVICGLIILFGGFRNTLIRYTLVLMVFFWFYDKRWAVLALFAMGAIWMAAIGMGDLIADLPGPVQRILGSLPGVYESDIAHDAMGGIAWRAELRSRFWDNEFWHHPWFGRGQVGDFFVATQSAMRDRYLFFEVTQLWHSGFVSTLDNVGIVGSLSFMLAQIVTLVRALRILATKKMVLDGWMFWCVANFLAANITYWYSGFFGKNFSVMALSMVGVWLVFAVLRIRERENAVENVDDDVAAEIVGDLKGAASVSV